MGDHSGGALWVADTFLEVDGVTRGGGGEAVLDCKGRWALFNGNAEHMTQPFGPRKDAPLEKCQRVSIRATQGRRIVPGRFRGSEVARWVRLAANR